MVWWNPLSWFGKAANTAQNLRKGAEGNLRSALTQYINAVKALETTTRTNNAVRGALNSTMFKRNGSNTTNSLSKVLANSVAKIVQGSSEALWAAANAGAAKTAANTAAQEAAAQAKANAAAARLRKTASSVKELNAILTNVFKNNSGNPITNNNARAAAYKNKRGNNKVNANRKLNESRGSRLTMKGRVPIPASYATLWAALTPAAPPPAPPAASNPALNAALAQLKNAVSSVENANVNNNDKYATRTNINGLNTAITNALAAVNAVNATAGGANRNKAMRIKAALNRIKTAAAAGAAPPAPAAPLNRATLNTLLAATNNVAVDAMNEATVNSRVSNIRNAAQAAGVNLGNANVNAALKRLNARKAALNPSAAP